MRLRRTRSASIRIRLLLIVPSVRHGNLNWGYALGVGSVLYRQPLASTGTPSRTSCRDHAIRTAADPGIPTPPRSRCVPFVASMFDRVSRDPGQTDAAAFQMDEEQDVVRHQ